MLYLDLDARNGESLSGVRCPTCGSPGRLRYHASYRRFVVDLGPSGLPAESRVWVDRVRCGACGATHALLPTSLVAYSPLTVRMCLAILSWCLDASRGPAEARRRSLVCRRTYERLANADARGLFALEGNAKVKTSRVIRETVDAGLIKPVDPDTAPRYMRYVPFWA